jgi:hypothetical protein
LRALSAGPATADTSRVESAGRDAPGEGQIGRIEMARSAKNEALRQRLSCGDYVVVPELVAEAILRLLGFRTSSMFVTPKPGQNPASGIEQNETPPGCDLA